MLRIWLKIFFYKKTAEVTESKYESDQSPLPYRNYKLFTNYLGSAVLLAVAVDVDDVDTLL